MICEITKNRTSIQSLEQTSFLVHTNVITHPMNSDQITKDINILSHSSKSHLLITSYEIWCNNPDMTVINEMSLYRDI